MPTSCSVSALYNETLCFGSEWGTKTEMHVEVAGTFRLYCRQLLPNLVTSELPVILPQLHETIYADLPQPPPNRPNHPSFSLKIGSFVTPSGKAALGVGNQLFVKNGRGEPFCSRRLGGCFPLKSLNPYSRAASAAMTTLPISTSVADPNTTKR